jgi:HAD superfamily phosphoserine phosphatase-like hydrolase
MLVAISAPGGHRAFSSTFAQCSFDPLSSKSMETLRVRALDPTRQEFLESVLRLEPRVAAFDCDGTLWSGDAGVTFFDWEIEQGIVSDQVAKSMRSRYTEYQAGKVTEDDMCGEMVTMHKGIAEAVMMQAATKFMAHSFPGHIFPEMRELVSRLRQDGCDVWAVSSSNEWVIRAGMREFGIPEDRILATKVELENGVITNRLVRIPSGPGKTEALREVAQKDVEAAFGNSRWDADMLAMAKHGFAVNPNPDLETTARQRGWIVYFPDGTRA